MDRFLTVLGHLRGLLGDFDGDQSNDLRTPSDGILQPTSTSEEIYQNFGLQCKITLNNYLYFTFSKRVMHQCFVGFFFQGG